MSVTIYPTVPGTLRRFPCAERRVPCDMCARRICQPGWCDDGVETVHEPTAPECNFANTNARALLLAVGLDPGEYLCGALAPDEVAAVVAECEAALRSDAQGLILRSDMLRAPEVVRDNFIVRGSTDERARERIAELLAVLRWAVACGAGISWS